MHLRRLRLTRILSVSLGQIRSRFIHVVNGRLEHHDGVLIQVHRRLFNSLSEPGLVAVIVFCRATYSILT